MKSSLSTLEKRAGDLDTSSAQVMTIDENGMTMILKMLSDLYPNPWKAVLREYACNARDSHVEAGQTKPIEVTLPTALDPELRIQDWGLGLSEHEVLNIFARYGSSTKRESNETIGAFGIGAKSAFAVANEFTVSTVKNNQKTITLFAQNEFGAPTVQVLFEGPSVEPNGLLVEVGIANVQAVREAADWLFSAWPKGTVLVNGEQPSSLWDNVSKLDDGLWVDWSTGYASYNTNRFQVIMGGVSYTIPADLRPRLSKSAASLIETVGYTDVKFVIEVPIGSVDITPERENLKSTDHTRDTINEQLDRLEVALQIWVQDQIKNAANIWEASRKTIDLSQKFGLGLDLSNMTYNGRKMGDFDVVLTAPTYRLQGRTRNGYTSNYSRYNWDSSTIDTGHQWYFKAEYDDQKFVNTLIVVNVPDKDKNKIKTYAKEFLTNSTGRNGNVYDVIISSDVASDDRGWFGFGNNHPCPLSTIEFDDYVEQGKAMRRDRLNQRQTARAGKTTYPTYSSDDTTEHMTADEIKATGKTVWWVASSYVRNEINPVMRELWDTDNYILVGVDGRKSPDVFLRNVPGAIRKSDVYHKEVTRQFVLITNADRQLIIRSQEQKIDYPDGINFLNKHRSQIVNQEVLDYLDDILASRTALTPDEKVEVDRLTLLYNANGLGVPQSKRGAVSTWFHNNLPLLALALHNTWTTDRVFRDSTRGRDESLIDYINSTVVTNP